MIGVAIVPSPLGELVVRWSPEGLVGIDFPDDDGAAVPATGQHQDEPAFGAGEQLRAYFAGQRRDFDLPLRPEGTDFQQRVWNELRCIPYGETRSYGQIARQLGQPGAARAVGMANHRNPLPIVVPCHRVIGHDGDLTGFGGGMARKRFLLDLESPVLTLGL